MKHQKDKYFKRAIESLRVSIDPKIKNFSQFCKYLEKEEIELEALHNTLSEIRETLPRCKDNIFILKQNIEFTEEEIKNDNPTKDELRKLKDEIAEYRYRLGELENFVFNSTEWIRDLNEAIEQNSEWLESLKQVEKQMKIEVLKELNKGKGFHFSIS